MGIFSDLFMKALGHGRVTTHVNPRPTATDRLQAQNAKTLAALGSKAAQAVVAQQQAAQAQQRQQQTLTPEQKFVLGQTQLLLGRDFQSSNPPKPAVHSVWYEPAQKSIYVRFMEHRGGNASAGPTYRYWTVDAQEAGAMFRASSKGEHVWDAFRVRGSKTAHKKNYALVTSGSPWIGAQAAAQAAAPTAAAAPAGGIFAALAKFTKP